MISFSLNAVCKARGIAKPYSFLVKNGFLPTSASKLVKGNVEYLRLEYLERICSLLNCLPNDLFEWVPENKADDVPEHPLYAIRKREEINVADVLRSLPMEKIKEVEALVASFHSK